MNIFSNPYFYEKNNRMGLIIIIPAIILVVAFLVSSIFYRRLVRHGAKMPFLWSALVFVGVCVLAWMALYYGFLISFHR